MIQNLCIILHPYILYIFNSNIIKILFNDFKVIEIYNLKNNKDSMKMQVYYDYTLDTIF